LHRLHSYDLETHLIQPGISAPPIVCGSTASFHGGQETSRVFIGKQEAVREVQVLLDDSDAIIVGANIAFDMGCLANADTSLLPSIFKAYDEGRVHDVLIAQALDAVANGHLGKHPSGEGPLTDSKGRQTERYSLDICVRLVLNRNDAKENDFWRRRYAILEKVPFALWPDDAVQYPKDDAWNTVEVGAVQLAYAGLEDPFRNLSDLPAQCETAFALHLGAMWGIRSDPERAALLEERATELHVEYVKRFKAYGFFKTDKKGKIVEDTAAVSRAVATAYGATEPCELCGKLGRVQKQNTVPCRGLKVKGRFKGCTATKGVVVVTEATDATSDENVQAEGGRVVEMNDPVLEFDPTSCEVCRGTGEVLKPGNIVICPDCRGTGFDIDPKRLPSLPRTEKGGVSSSRDTMSESGDETLIEFGKNKQEKILKTYLPFIKRGIHAPITLKPNVLLESGRVSYEDIIQTFPRWKLKPFKDGRWVPSPRECFMARPGRFFGSTDYAALELCTLAQVCLWVCKGQSKMADAINATKEPGDLHTALGARLMNISFEEMKARIKAKDKVAKDFRQASKPVNFGLPGGMRAATLVLSSRKENNGSTQGPDGREYDGIRFCILIGGARECGTKKVTEWQRQVIPPTCEMCLKLAEDQLIPAWFDQWPEMKEYFGYVKREIEITSGEIPCFGPWLFKPGVRRVPHRIRGGTPWRAAANNGFQALAADGAKYALRKVTREAYTDESSALYQGRVRIPMFIHDELFSEGDEETAHIWGPRIAEIMVDAMREWVPDVWVAAETALMKHWNKDAEPTYTDGKLVPWYPKKAA